MCLMIDVRKHRKREVKRKTSIPYVPKEAKKDIIVYKSIKSSGASPIMNFKYVPGKTHHTQMKRALHSVIGEGPIRVPEAVGEGFHSSLIETETLTRCVKCIIPKGALYYIDENGYDVVSNKIKILKNQ